MEVVGVVQGGVHVHHVHPDISYCIVKSREVRGNPQCSLRHVCSVLDLG